MKSMIFWGIVFLAPFLLLSPEASLGGSISTIFINHHQQSIGIGDYCRKLGENKNETVPFFMQQSSAFKRIELNNGTENDTSAPGNSTTSSFSLYLQNGCCVYEDGNITDLTTGENRTATDEERQQAQTYAEEEGRRQQAEFSSIWRRFGEAFGRFWEGWGSESSEEEIKELDNAETKKDQNKTVKSDSRGEVGPQGVKGNEMPCFCSTKSCRPSAPKIESDETKSGKKKEEANL